MRKTEAFNALGYPLRSTRGLWSTETDDSVLMTVWQRQIGWMPDPRGWHLYWDLDLVMPPATAERATLNRNAKLTTRVRHLRRVLDEPGVALDVVLMFGEVGNERGEAYPWRPEENGSRTWQVCHADLETLSFRMEARPPLRG